MATDTPSRAPSSLRCCAAQSDTRLDGWDGCSGYHYSDNRIYGFSHTHLSGTGCSDYGDILIMPFSGSPSIHNNEYSCTFSHKNEQASPGHYRVLLDNGVQVELTTGKYVAMHRYTFPKKGPRGIIIDLTHRDKVLASGITHQGNEFFGFRRSEAWNPDQYCAFSILPSSPVQRVEYFYNDQPAGDHDVRGENCKAILYFADNVRTVTLNVAISAVDILGAMNNQKEIQGLTFDQVRNNAVSEWNRELGKIKVESSNEEFLRTFYTALYHCFTSPYLYSDLTAATGAWTAKSTRATANIRYIRCSRCGTPTEPCTRCSTSSTGNDRKTSSTPLCSNTAKGECCPYGSSRPTRHGA